MTTTVKPLRSISQLFDNYNVSRKDSPKSKTCSLSI